MNYCAFCQFVEKLIPTRRKLFVGIVVIDYTKLVNKMKYKIFLRESANFCQILVIEGKQ